MSDENILYTTLESVKVRLANKVQFQSDPKELQQGELPNALLCQLIADAETKVEQALRGRYAIPFQSCKTKKFCDLPDHSKRALRRAVDMACVMEILRTDFGRGSSVSGSNYYKESGDEYKAYIKELLGQDQEGELRKRYRFAPPLDQVQLAAGNTEADDGYKGMLINTDGNPNSVADYAGHQINDPSQTWVRRRGWGGL